MGLEFLFGPFDRVDTWIASLLADAPLLGALVLAAVLGLRHATDPDHLAAVTSLVADRGRDVRAGARIGAWWGVGHATVLLLAGVPLVVAHSTLPAWLEAGAEKLIGVVIAVLALRLLWTWSRGGYATTDHRHPPATAHRHVHEGDHGHARGRTGAQALAIGALHGLAGTGAIVVLMIASLPSRGQALAALAVFAPMSVVSMVLCTTAFSWLLTRPRMTAALGRTLIPLLGVFGLVFGTWYAGIG
jgi:hypothetical protein